MFEFSEGLMNVLGDERLIDPCGTIGPTNSQSQSNCFQTRSARLDPQLLRDRHWSWPHLQCCHRYTGEKVATSMILELKVRVAQVFFM